MFFKKKSMAVSKESKIKQRNAIKKFDIKLVTFID